MGERVVVGGAPPPPQEPPKPVEPLSYAEPSTSSIWDDRVMAVIRLVGGARQILFALGLACVGAGVGEFDGFDGSGDASAWFAFGGLFLGLAIPVPRWRS